MKPRFAIGQPVMHKSGGPSMVVNSYVGTVNGKWYSLGGPFMGRVSCEYWNGKYFVTETFSEDVLMEDR